MNALTAFLQKLRLRQIITVFLAGFLLIISTACAGGSEVGARPDNPPVQIGGQNNPYKGGGDRNTNLNATTDPKIINKKADGRDQASLPLSQQLIASNTNKEVLLYPGAETPEGRAYKESELPIKTERDFREPEPGGLNQRQEDIGTRIKDRIETVQEAVKEATSFVKDKADEAGARPEFKANPAAQ
ncbi:DUF6658 family protein [Iningainema tapete]|uniref:Uncharacterized protein n=1 Tax=Iningainema tapete BLCC-T55 TaxID=2748662 RepID=A0A8J7CBG1_9CYAN|nr:hypothetical protein [Iningainema tapete BLCC-T55]